MFLSIWVGLQTHTPCPTLAHARRPAVLWNTSLTTRVPVTVTTKTRLAQKNSHANTRRPAVLWCTSLTTRVPVTVTTKTRLARKNSHANTRHPAVLWCASLTNQRRAARTATVQSERGIKRSRRRLCYEALALCSIMAAMVWRWRSRAISSASMPDTFSILSNACGQFSRISCTMDAFAFKMHRCRHVWPSDDVEHMYALNSGSFFASCRIK